MCLFHVVSRFDTHKLCHQAVHQIGIELGLVGICTRSQPQFHQFRIGHIIQSEQVGTRLFDSRAVSLQRVGVYARKQFAGTMSQTLMQVGMQFIGRIGIFIYQLQFGIAIYKLFVEAVAMGRLVVSIRYIANRYGFGAVMAADPVGIGQVDTDSRRRIEVARQNSGSDYLG